MNKKILVTGGLGFIGSNLVDVLVKDENKEIYVIDNLVSGSEGYKNPKATYYIQDIRNIFKKECFEMIESLDALNVIFHLAALPRIQESLKNPAETISVNSYGTLQVAELARKFDAKMVYSSTSAIEGDIFFFKYFFSEGEIKYKNLHKIFR